MCHYLRHYVLRLASYVPITAAFFLVACVRVVGQKQMLGFVLSSCYKLCVRVIEIVWFSLDVHVAVM